VGAGVNFRAVENLKLLNLPKMPNGINYVLRLFAIQSRFLLGLDVLRTSTTYAGNSG
jgi:hypothetical protein